MHTSVCWHTALLEDVSITVMAQVDEASLAKAFSSRKSVNICKNYSKIKRSAFLENGVQSCNILLLHLKYVVAQPWEVKKFKFAKFEDNAN